MEINLKEIELVSSKLSQSHNSSSSLREEDDKLNIKLNDPVHLYLDAQLHLKDEDDDDFDEDKFNFSKNSHKFIQNAFDIDDKTKKEWQGKFIKMAVEEEFTSSEENLKKIINEKMKEKRNFDNFKYSFNVKSEDWDENQSMMMYSNFFPKLLIALNLLFRISYIYKFSYEMSYSKSFFTIYRLIVLQLFDFDQQETLFSINNITNQYAFLSLVFIWLICFIIFYCMSKQSQIIRKIDIENYLVKYEFKNYSPSKKILFNCIFVIFIYFYIPIVRDSIMTIFFIVEQVKYTSSFQIFFQTTDSRNVILWIKFFLCCVVAIALFLVPFFVYKLINNNYPFLDPFDENNDTIFHSVTCPNNCSGALLDIDKRICWDFIDKKNNFFMADLERPIDYLNHTNKKKTLLLKYVQSCNTLKSPLMMFFKGFSWYYKNSLFWFLIYHYIFIFVIKIPFSTVFPKFGTRDLEKRSLISYSFSTFMCLYLVYEDCKHTQKFNFKHDKILSLIVNILVLVINLVSIIRIGIVGDYVFQTLQIADYQNSIMSIMDILSFSTMMVCLVVLLIFIIFSIPKVKDKITKQKLIVPYEWLEPLIKEKDIRYSIIEYLWKPFWDNIFLTDKILSKEIDVTNQSFIDMYVDGKRLEKFNKKGLAMTPFNRFKIIKRQMIKNQFYANAYEEDHNSENFEEDTNKIFEDAEDYHNNSLNFEKMSQCDVLLRKWIQMNLEGIDVFWDGDVSYIRTCHNFFGRLIVSDNPFNLFIIYDETNEKCQIPKSEWIALAKLNFKNQDIIRQVKLRDTLRSLNMKNVKYDEFYFKKNVEEDKYKIRKEVENLPLNNKSRYMTKSNLQKIKLEPDSLYSDVKKGILKVESIVPENHFTHGFKIYMEIQDKKNPEKLKETKIFDSNDISLNTRNFRYSNLNILLTMNKNLINEDLIHSIKLNKESYREEICYKRYINEITLSSLFYNIIYNNQDVSLMDIFKYFLKFEKQKEMKLFPFFHIDGFIQVINLWHLCLTNSVQGLWFIFFNQIWKLNKKILEEKKVSKYFNPDTSLSICYYVLSKSKINSFIYHFNLQSLITKEIIDKLYEKIQDLKNLEKDKMSKKIKEAIEKKILNENKDSLDHPSNNKNSSKKKKKNFKKESNEDSSRINLKSNTGSKSSSKQSKVNSKSNSNNNNSKIDEDKLEYYLSNNKTYRDKFMEVVLEYSPCEYVMPSWVYLTFNNDCILQKLDTDELNEYRHMIKSYFTENMKNPERLFSQLGKYALCVGLYTDTEIFELYDSKHLKCEDPELARFILEKKNTGNYSDFKSLINSSNKIHKSNKLTAADWGSKSLDIYLPPVYKFISEKFDDDLGANYIQKIDDRGRVFYVDETSKLTTFLHPMLKKREKSRAESEIELMNGPLPEGWEIINYRSNITNEVRLLYVDHNLKKTTWIDPRRKKKLIEK